LIGVEECDGAFSWGGIEIGCVPFVLVGRTTYDG
jgi:hypothetical protein